MRRRSNRWRSEVWPDLKAQARREHRTLVFVDEAGFYLLPGRVRTYAPAGHTPVLHEWQTRGHLSVMGAVIPTGKIYVLVRQESLNGLHTIEFLRHLIRHVGPQLLVIWDRSPIHRRVAVKEFLDSSTGRSLRVERLPPYAPDLNPVEWAWQHLKHVEMRNLITMDLEELHLELHLVIGRLRQKPRLIHSFFIGAGLEAEKFPCCATLSNTHGSVHAGDRWRRGHPADHERNALRDPGGDGHGPRAYQQGLPGDG